MLFDWLAFAAWDDNPFDWRAIATRALRLVVRRDGFPEESEITLRYGWRDRVDRMHWNIPGLPLASRLSSLPSPPPALAPPCPPL